MSEFPRIFSTNFPRMTRRSLAATVALVCLSSLPTTALAQKTEKLTKALSQKPLQDDVPFDIVPNDKIEKCDIEELTRPDGKGFLVTGEGGQTLRWFVDTNGDNKLDRWCYYSQGVETYREIDADFDRVADQFRWLGTGGTRWGIDENKDGKIDRWKMISAEELTAEIVKAAAARDGDRFATLIATDKGNPKPRTGHRQKQHAQTEGQGCQTAIRKMGRGPKRCHQDQPLDALRG